MAGCSKREIRRAGHILIGRTADEDSIAAALEKIDHWRAIHAEPLGRLLDEAEKIARPFPDLLIAGRLKKRSTIIDKLRRADTVDDLDTMYDIAGCRIVVRDIQELHAVVEKALESPFCDASRSHDYISHPKSDGYRGVHLIFRFDDLACGHALRAELQVRTELEHAWATAIEMHDAAARTRLKFENDDSLPFWFFKRASRLIEELESGREIDARKIRSIGEAPSAGKAFLDVIGLLGEANDAAFFVGAETGISIHDYCLIDLDVSQQMLLVLQLKDEEAVDSYFRFERESAQDEHDIVLTKGFTMDGLRRLYPNYFGNIDPFINLIEKHMDCFF